MPIISSKSGDNRTQTDLQWLMLMSVTFISGFSERLAKDLVTSTENRFNSGANFNQQQARGLKMPIEQVDSKNGSSPKEKQ